jgi:hypothetical protein
VDTKGGAQEWPGDRRNPMTDENKTASLQAIYFKIARIAAETNPIETAAESGHSTSSNVVRLRQMIARGARRAPECAHAASGDESV